MASEEVSFLRQVTEKEEVGCDETPWDGWHPRLFHDASDVADVHTAPTDATGSPIGAVPPPRHGSA